MKDITTTMERPRGGLLTKNFKKQSLPGRATDRQRRGSIWWFRFCRLVLAESIQSGSSGACFLLWKI